jgi:hypothetical protein
VLILIFFDTFSDCPLLLGVTTDFLLVPLLDFCTILARFFGCRSDGISCARSRERFCRLVTLVRGETFKRLGVAVAVCGAGLFLWLLFRTVIELFCEFFVERVVIRNFLGACGECGGLWDFLLSERVSGTSVTCETDGLLDELLLLSPKLWWESTEGEGHDKNSGFVRSDTISRGESDLLKRVKFLTLVEHVAKFSSRNCKPLFWTLICVLEKWTVCLEKFGAFFKALTLPRAALDEISWMLIFRTHGSLL